MGTMYRYETPSRQAGNSGNTGGILVPVPLFRCEVILLAIDMAEELGLSDTCLICKYHRLSYMQK